MVDGPSAATNFLEVLPCKAVRFCSRAVQLFWTRSLSCAETPNGIPKENVKKSEHVGEGGKSEEPLSFSFPFPSSTAQFFLPSSCDVIYVNAWSWSRGSSFD